MADPRAPLIDVHAHFVTEEYASAARAAGHEHPDGMPGWPSWSAPEHLRLMDQWGVATSILSIFSPGVHFGDDQAAGKLAELAYATGELGSTGVTVAINTAGTCAEQVSLGRPRPMLEFIFDSTRAVSDLVFSGTLTRYPDIQWVFTLGGGTLPLLVQRMDLFGALFGADPDEPGVQQPGVQEQAARLWFDMAGTPFPLQVPTLIAAFGSERLLYGSDYCWTPAAGVGQQVAAIDSARPPAGDTWRALTTRNAERLLRRSQPR